MCFVVKTFGGKLRCTSASLGFADVSPASQFLQPLQSAQHKLHASYCAGDFFFRTNLQNPHYHKLLPDFKLGQKRKMCYILTQKQVLYCQLQSIRLWLPLFRAIISQ
ncbi:hypothetical protein CHARACLAT_012856 [Characodon lateralis]|uniref:Uncharacterized protein n=1 Tax=Characodon lateralis TaxID=208331 RepID=A0ABU7EIK5_9TELE|nr:hypothetical protein [Characodon lateralis]